MAVHLNLHKGKILQEYFCLGNRETMEDMTQCTYPKPAFEFHPITDVQIEGAIRMLNLLKTPGPNCIGNVIFKQCQSLLTLHLSPIFRALFSTHHYLKDWKESRTVVLRKPNKQDYTTPKAYRPIALLDTMSKILWLCVARTLTLKSKRHKLLEKHQF